MELEDEGIVPESLAAALALGADAVAMGTRFVATTEARAHANYKNALAGAKPEDTRTEDERKAAKDAKAEARKATETDVAPEAGRAVPEAPKAAWRSLPFGEAARIPVVTQGAANSVAAD